MEHPDYYPLREHLIEFLEVHSHRRRARLQIDAPQTRLAARAAEKSVSEIEGDDILERAGAPIDA
jgi:hypothetical protein